MIWRPKPGQAVQIRYRKAARDKMVIQSAAGVYYRLHEIRGIVEAAGTGRGPINALVRIRFFSGDLLIVVPRGNLFSVNTATCNPTPGTFTL